jgi:hypothetical protein
MNELTKFLIEELLDTKKTVAIYGGGFKPPTKGHFTVAKQTLEELPDIDELKIFVGGGVRDGITQDESIKIWNIYKNYLSDKVNIEPSVAPVKSVLNYAKDNPDTKVYWVLGAREGEDSDLEDIAYRTRTISKYPNLEVKVITSTGGISGTKTRQAVKDNNKEQFFQFIPDIKEKDQIWNIVSPVVKEEKITEVGEANLKPYKWQELDMNGYIVFTRFMTDSETQYDINLETIPYYPEDSNSSIKALSVEFIAKPKGAEGSSAKIVVNKGELYRVMATITDIIKKYIKKLKVKAILYSPSKKQGEDFGTQRDQLYKAFIKKAIPGVKFEKKRDIVAAILPDVINELVTNTEVICDNCGWEWPIADGGKDLYICHKCGHDNNPDLDEASDPQAGTALPYGSGFAPVKENDVFGLNKLAETFVKETFEKDWNLQDGMLSLSKYMIDNGMNIKPLPKIKVIKDDKENASNLLGKTAYYNPMDKSITLYTMNRHPKDVLRSFSHEMVHHMQNLEGRLNDINTTNTNEDGDLPEIEREAYEKGNMMLRNWEDNIKNV